MPVLYVSAASSSVVRSRNAGMAAEYPLGFYDCPVYKYPERTDRHLVFTCKLPTKNKPPSHWTLRGVAVLCCIP
jgi:dynein heavy chain